MSSETESIAGSLNGRLKKLQSNRNTLDNHCQEISDRLGRDDGFISQQSPEMKGRKTTDKMFDSTFPIAADRFASVLDSMNTPQGQTWHKLKCSDPSLNRILRVREYHEEVTRILFNYRYAVGNGRTSPGSGYASQQHEVYYSLGVFGTGAILTEPLAGGGMWYRSLSLSNTWVASNHQGLIDTVFRRFRFTVKQAMNQWGDKCPKCVIEKKDKPDEEFEFVQAILPRDDYQPDRMDYKGMPFASYYLCTKEPETLIAEGGYHTFPIAVSRYSTANGELYGRSPAMMCLPDIKMLNEMEKTIINAAHLQVQPPLLIGDELMSSPVQYKPGAINRGAVNSQGQPMIHELRTSGRIDLGVELSNQKRQTINDAFLLTLFQILLDSHTMTATEIIEKSREKGILLAPTISRQQNELLGPQITRDIDILARQGRLPPMPPELIEAGGQYEIVYDSPLARAQRSEEVVGFARTIEMLTPLYQVDQSVLDPFNFKKATLGIAEINGAPASWMFTEEEMAAKDEQKAAQAQAAALLEAAPVMAQAQLNTEKAQQIAQSGAAGRI